MCESARGRLFSNPITPWTHPQCAPRSRLVPLRPWHPGILAPPTESHRRDSPIGSVRSHDISCDGCGKKPPEINKSQSPPPPPTQTLCTRWSPRDTCAQTTRHGQIANRHTSAAWHKDGEIIVWRLHTGWVFRPFFFSFSSFLFHDDTTALSL